MDPASVIMALEAQIVLENRRFYQRMYRLTHPEKYEASKKLHSAKLTERRREVPEVREKHLADLKLYTQTHRAERNAYARAYNARKRAEREAAMRHE